MNKQNFNNDHILELLYGGIDGELSTAQQDELNLLMETSEEVRELDKELRAFTGLLDGLPEREPPEYLRGVIENQIMLPVPNPGHLEKQGFLGAWLSANWLRTGLALAAGVVLTVGIYQVGSEFPAGQNTADMTGTIVQNPEAQKGTLLDQVDFESALLDGVVELRDRDGLVAVDVQFGAAGTTGLSIDFGGRGLEYTDIVQLQDQTNTISIEDGSVHVASSGGQHYVLLLRRISKVHGQQVPPLELEFFADNMLIHKAELDLVE